MSLKETLSSLMGGIIGTQGPVKTAAPEGEPKTGQFIRAVRGDGGGEDCGSKKPQSQDPVNTLRNFGL